MNPLKSSVEVPETDPVLSPDGKKELEDALADSFVMYFRAGLPRFEPENIDLDALGRLVRLRFPDDYLRMSAAGWF